MCFSLEWLHHILAWLITVVVIITVLKLLVPYLLSLIGWSTGPFLQIVNIIVWGIIALFILDICFELLRCLGGMRVFRFSLMNFVGVG